MAYPHPPLVLGFEDFEPQGKRLAERLDYPYGRVTLHRFPDGEARVTLPPELPPTVIFCRSLNQPNDKLVELMLAAETARELGAGRLILVAPYLCYMRQDIAFNPGEAVSQRIVGRFLGELFDGIVTVDPHLHRITSLEEVMPRTAAVCLSAGPAMAEFLTTRRGTTLLVGPDEESAQWVSTIARAAGLDFVVATKQRLGDKEVETCLPSAQYHDASVVLVDDMASTGHTLMSVARQLRKAGAARVDCLITHALFAPDTAPQLREAGIDHVWSSDSIAHPSNAVALDQALALAVRQLVSP